MSTDKTNKHIKPYIDIKVGDIVMVSDTKWNNVSNCVEVHNEPCIVVVLWRGGLNNDLILLTRVGEYNPFWCACKDAVEVVGHTNLKEMIEKIEVENEV